ncbi:MAG: hypothetical protein KDH19_02490 [Geminicoccaceae bacterium]|nr:hypothetical protein [Geminicoccaceae bacterium]
MTTGKIENRTVVGHRLDHAIESLSTDNRTNPAERTHLRRFHAPPGDHVSPGNDMSIDWTGSFMAPAGLAQALDERLMPRLRDPSVLERARFVLILRDIGNELDQTEAEGDTRRLSQIARNVIRREIERTLKLQARIGELVEG